MKIGYPCINTTVGCTTNSTFRLSSYSENRLKKTVASNLDCLKNILQYNVSNDILFFRISSDIVPFASHPVCEFSWAKRFSEDLSTLGGYIRKHDIRISMHPDQFVLINSTRQEVNDRSIKELAYQCTVLDRMNLDSTAKVQLHVGGVYGDKQGAMLRFTKNYDSLPEAIKRRLVIENDHRLFSVEDCFRIAETVNIPVLFDVFHHSCLNHDESVREAVQKCMMTWRTRDGVLMVDYSNQKRKARTGVHAWSIDLGQFRSFLKRTKGLDFDIMLEIKDKERSVLKAQKVLNSYWQSGTRR